MNGVQTATETELYEQGATVLQPHRRRGVRAFTLVECLVVIGILALLAALLLPALAKSKATALSAVCLNNLKQLQSAWLAYAHDHDDTLPPNISRRVEFDQVNVAGSWVLGNTIIDTNSDNLRAGVLYPYVRGGSFYHCPVDKSTVYDRPDLVRTRSYSISLWLNVDLQQYGDADLATTDPHNMHKLSRIITPSGTWVLIDEHPLSIDDGVFLIPPGNEGVAWSSYRGDRHNNGANLSFADGHAERYQWRCHRKFPPYTANWIPTINADDRADLTRLEAGLPQDPEKPGRNEPKPPNR